MVLGVVMMPAMLPTIIGLNEATQGSREQEENRRNTARKQRCHLVATCSLSQGSPELREQVRSQCKSPSRSRRESKFRHAAAKRSGGSRERIGADQRPHCGC